VSSIAGIFIIGVLAVIASVSFSMFLIRRAEGRSMVSRSLNCR
jgi:hypothetical protein